MPLGQDVTRQMPDGPGWLQRRRQLGNWSGWTGRRVAAGLQTLGIPVRIGSRSATPPFDWDDAAGWDACLLGVDAVYITYAPDLAMPGATDAIQALVDRAERLGVRRLVLLSGRGEPEAQACEGIVQQSGLEWTVVRASWFFQNFSEGAFTEMVVARRITLPAGGTPEPLVDVGDIAEVAIAALSETGHAGQVYEVTGPRLMTFADIAARSPTDASRSCLSTCSSSLTRSVTSVPKAVS